MLMPVGLRLALMVLLAAAPIFAILVVRELDLREARRDHIVERVQTLAEQIAARQDRFVESAQVLLTAISRLDIMHGANAAQCSHELQQISDQLPAIAGIDLVNPDGHSFCASNEKAASVNLADSRYFQAALRSRAMQTSDYIVGGATGSGSFVFAYPVLGNDKKVQSVIILAFQTSVLAQDLNDPALPSGTFAALVDRNGLLVARWPDPEKWIGRDLSAAGWVKTALKTRHGITRTALEGTKGDYALAYAPMEAPTSLTVLVGQPLTPELERLDIQFWQEMGLISAVFLLAALVAWLGAAYGVQRPIRALADHVDAVSRGEFNRPDGSAVSSGIPELRALAERFQSMGRALAAREKELKDAVQQKDMLLKEVNHRVKNSLQLVASLFGLQKSRIADPQLRGLFEEAAQRVATIARVHQRLYQDQYVDSVPFDEFLTELCDGLRKALSSGNEPRLQCHASACRLSTDKAIPLALIVNELVTNAFKYGYPEGRTGTIRVDCRTEAKAIVLTVADDGKALPADFDPAKSAGLGMRVVDGLVRQLQGKLEVRADQHGKAFVIHVPT
jgi:two-component sensor histidine kinase